MTNIDTRTKITLEQIIQRILRGDVVIMLGPFGSGKSLSVHKIWTIYSKQYKTNAIEITPIALNLREHWGAKYADEILRRHALSIELKSAADLTLAWRAGMLILLVDGFDEMASQGIAEIRDVKVLRQVRQTALSGVRDLFLKSPTHIGGLITGRDHYFDDQDELVHTLGIEGRRIARVQIDEFDDIKAREYLKHKKIDIELPDWLPRKALLLGYLARRDLLKDVLSIDGHSGQAKAWTEFINPSTKCLTF